MSLSRYERKTTGAAEPADEDVLPRGVYLQAETQRLNRGVLPDHTAGGLHVCRGIEREHGRVATPPQCINRQRAGC